MSIRFHGATALLALVLSSKSPQAWGQDAWSNASEDPARAKRGMVGLGVATMPDAPGADAQRTVALPVVNMRFEGSPFYLGNPYGAAPVQAGVAWPIGAGFKAGAALSLQPNEIREASEAQRAAGVQDIDGDPLASVFLHWEHARYAATLTATQALGDSAQGQTATLRLQRAITPTPNLRITLGPSLSWANGENMRTYFGVPVGSETLAQYTPSGGLQNISANLGVTYAFSPDWLLGGGVKLSRLQADAADSPLVEDDVQHSGWLFVARSF